MSSVSLIAHKARHAIGYLPGVRSIYGTNQGCATVECFTKHAALEARNRLRQNGMEVSDISYYPRLSRWMFGAIVEDCAA